LLAILQFIDFLHCATIKTNGKIQKLSSELGSDGERVRRAVISLEKTLISAVFESGHFLGSSFRTLTNNNKKVEII
jgi:hypothetical protein